MVTLMSLGGRGGRSGCILGTRHIYFRFKLYADKKCYMDDCDMFDLRNRCSSAVQTEKAGVSFQPFLSCEIRREGKARGSRVRHLLRMHNVLVSNLGIS